MHLSVTQVNHAQDMLQETEVLVTEMLVTEVMVAGSYLLTTDLLQETEAMVSKPDLFTLRGGGEANPYCYHPDPVDPMSKSYLLACINVESAHTQFDKIVSYDAEAEHPPNILMVCEHRIMDKDISGFKRRFAEQGWQLHAVPAPAENGRTHAGVAILTRSGLRCYLHENDLPQWQKCGRFITGSIIAPTGKHLFELAGIYGYADPAHHRREQQQLFDNVASWLAPRHNLPLAVVGDLNDDAQQYATTAHWTAAGLLTDILAQHENPKVYTHASGSILDHALGTPAFMRLCQRGWTHNDFIFPCHRGLHIQVASKSQPYLSYLSVPPLPTSRLAKLHLQQQLEARQTPKDFTQALTLGDIDTAHAIWCSRWERLLTQSCVYTGATVEQCPPGRAQTTTTRHTHPVERAMTVSYLPLELRQCYHTINLLRNLIHDELRHEQQVTWDLRINWTHRRQKLARRLHDLHKVDFDPEDPLSPECALTAVEPVLKQLQAQHRKETANKWHQKMTQYKSACKYVTAQAHTRLDRLQLSTGEWTTDVDKMDEELRAFWQQQAIADPHTLDDIRYNSRRLVDSIIPESDYIVLETINTKDVLNTIASLKNQAAPGPGCWHPTDLKSLPEIAIGELAQLYVACEKWQHFPRLFAESVTTNIPKAPGKAKAADLRPISVYPLLWRVYAKLRAHQTTAQIAPRLSAHQHGAIPGASVEDVVTEIKMAVDNCVAETGQIHGLQVDIQKCFNSLDVDIALYTLQKMGLPPSLAQLWNAHYMRHTTRHRYPGSVLGTPYSPARGIAQGDPLAVLLANAQISIIPKALAAKGEHLQDMQQWWFLDDSTIIGSKQETIRDAYSIMQETFQTLALRICVPKTVYFTHSPGTPIQLGMDTLTGVVRLEILGADVQVPDPQAPDKPLPVPQEELQGRNAKRWNQVLPRIKLLRHLPGGPQYKTKIASACIAALWRYAPFGVQPGRAQLQGIQQALQDAIFGPGLREAAREILQGHLLPFHFTHLDYARTYALLRLLRRAWLRGRLTETTLHTDYLRHSYMYQLREALRTVRLQLDNGTLHSPTTGKILKIYTDTDQRVWLHELCELCRDDLAYQLSQRRPREFAHCSKGIAREATFGIWPKHRNAHETTIMRNWFSGSLAYKERQWRHHRGPNGPSPYCNWCWFEKHALVKETVLHIIEQCELGSRYRQEPCWALVQHLPPGALETGTLPTQHNLTKDQLKLWPLVQKCVLKILMLRNQRLPALEQDYGSPPSCPKPGSGPRYRLIGKQPPTDTCPDQRPRRACGNRLDQVIAEPNEDGEWLFNNHRVVQNHELQIPVSPLRPRFLFCVFCRRSASLQEPGPQQALKIIHKRNRTGCNPSQHRTKIDSTLVAHLLKAHLVESVEGSKTLLRCELCGEVNNHRQREGTWGNKHALCFWLRNET